LRSKQLADRSLAGFSGAHQENNHGGIIAGYGRARNSPRSMWKW
jgi:hypothetical protein